MEWQRMLVASKWLLILAGVELIVDSLHMFFGVKHHLFDWPLPCPITLLPLGVGLLLFAISANSFKKD